MLRCVAASEAASEAAACVGSAATVVQAAKRLRQQGNRYAALAPDDDEMCEAAEGAIDALAQRRAQVTAEAEAKAASAEAAAAEWAARKEAGKAQRARVALEGVKKFNHLRGEATVENFLCALQEGGRDFSAALRLCLAALAAEDVRVAAAGRAAAAEEAAAAEGARSAALRGGAALSAALRGGAAPGVALPGAEPSVVVPPVGAGAVLQGASSRGAGGASPGAALPRAGAALPGVRPAAPGAQEHAAAAPGAGAHRNVPPPRQPGQQQPRQGRKKRKWEREKYSRPAQQGLRPSHYKTVLNEAFFPGSAAPRYLKLWWSQGAFVPPGRGGAQGPPPEGWNEYYKRCCAWGGEARLIHQPAGGCAQQVRARAGGEGTHMHPSPARCHTAPASYAAAARGVQAPVAEAPPSWTAAVESLAQQQAQTTQLLSKLIASLAALSAAPPLSPPVAGSRPG